MPMGKEGAPGVISEDDSCFFDWGDAHSLGGYNNGAEKPKMDMKDFQSGNGLP